MSSGLLEVRELSVQYITDDDIVHAVNGIDLSISNGESLGLVGETGAGKTTTALAIMQLLPQPAGVITGGEILFNGVDLIMNSERENRKMRGEGISMIFQDPMTALNPTVPVGEQMVEALREHRKASPADAQKACMEMLETVGISRNRFRDYPHQLSGGMRQRVVIAMALLCNPKLLIADEPTTALDVTIQAQVLEIIADLIEKRNMALLLITHDLGVVAETCTRVAVMYAGQIVESGTVLEVYKEPRHPYTIGLFGSIPRLDDECDMLTPIEGQTANPAALPPGCPFHPRCPWVTEKCSREAPGYTGVGHRVKCHLDLREAAGGR